MAPTRPGALLLALLACCAACRPYVVAEAQLDRLKGKRDEQRRTIAVPARRLDGTPVYLRADSFHVVGPAGPGARRLRTTPHDLVTVGIPVLAVGLAALTLAVVVDARSAEHNAYDLGGYVVGSVLSAGGAVMLGFGARGRLEEVRPGRAGVTYLP